MFRVKSSFRPAPQARVLKMVVTLFLDLRSQMLGQGFQQHIERLLRGDVGCHEAHEARSHPGNPSLLGLESASWSLSAQRCGTTLRPCKSNRRAG